MTASLGRWRRHVAWGGLGALSLLTLLAGPAAAQPARVALVIGNGAYSATPSIPPLPGCPQAARGVAAALRSLGFELTERMDAGRGEADAAWVAFTRRLREAPGAVAVAYVCGHVVTYNGRPFLLPVSAVLERESDVLTQGLLARAVADSLLRNGAAGGLVALDAYSPPTTSPSAPGAPGLRGASGLTALAEAAAAGGVGFIAATPDGSSPMPSLAGALRAELAGPDVTLGNLLAGVRRRLPAASLLALGEPTAPVQLAGGAAPPAPAPAPVQPAAPPAAAVPAPVAPPATAAVPSPAASAAPDASAGTLPDEARMTVADRRRVQTALTAIGYYNGVADGVFGANTRAAIRRFQFELGAEMTGVLTGAQATRLVGNR
ncbi:peptidoglycan-binding protein [Muricoccus radiodurans]|uniref:peptidoglycan-binding protein n=1 Tax=Muricoccus radiodurans TaxID=2231721 RepID=UPI003CFA4F3E